MRTNHRVTGSASNAALTGIVPLLLIAWGCSPLRIVAQPPAPTAPPSTTPSPSGSPTTAPAPPKVANAELPKPAPLSDYTETEYPYPQTGVALGQGWNSIYGVKVTSVCISGTPEATLPISSVSSRYQYIFDREQLASLLTNSGSGSYSGYGVTASVQASFTESNSLDQSETHVLGSVIVERPGQALALTDGKLTLTPEALKLVNDQSFNQDPSAFLKMCGDSFVSAIRFGGRYDVLYSASTSALFNSQGSQLSVAASGYGATASYSQSSQSTSTVTRNATDVRDLAVGLDLDQRVLAATVADATTNMTAASRYNKAGQAYMIAAYPYIALANWPKDKALALDDSLRNYYAMYLRLSDLYATYVDAALQPQLYYFPFMTRAEVNTTATQIALARQCIEAYLSKCRETGQCTTTTSSADSARFSAWAQLTGASSAGCSASSLPSDAVKTVAPALERPPESKPVSDLAGLELIASVLDSSPDNQQALFHAFTQQVAPSVPPNPQPPDALPSPTFAAKAEESVFKGVNYG